MHLVDELSWGALLPSQVQRIAFLAKRDQDVNAQTNLRDDIAAAGSSGENPGSTQRDLFRKIPRDRLPAIAMNRIPVQHKLLGRGRPELPFLYPHAMFSLSLIHI